MATLKLGNDLQNYIKQLVLDTYYPIGSLYLTVGNTNPTNQFGGTWQKITGYYLYADSSITTTNYTGKGTQGHQLTSGQLPRISAGWTMHSQERGTGFYNQSGCANGSKINNVYMNNGSQGSGAYSYTLSWAFGNNEKHSHNIATKGIYVWQRTA